MSSAHENDAQFWTTTSRRLPLILACALSVSIVSMIWNAFLATSALTAIYIIGFEIPWNIVWNTVYQFLRMSADFIRTVILIPQKYYEAQLVRGEDLLGCQSGDVCIEMRDFADDIELGLNNGGSGSLDEMFQMKNVVSFSDLCALVVDNDSAETSSDLDGSLSSSTISANSSELSLSQLGETTEFISPAERLKTLIQNYKDKHNLSERVLKAIYKRYREQIQEDPTLQDVIRTEAVQCRLKSSSTCRRHTKKSFQALPLSKTTIEWI